MRLPYILLVILLLNFYVNANITPEVTASIIQAISNHYRVNCVYIFIDDQQLSKYVYCTNKINQIEIIDLDNG